METKSDQPRLIGDIGGTNVRFAIARNGAHDEPVNLATLDHPSFESAIAAYLDRLGEKEAIRDAAFAVAGPVAGDSVVLTNHNWSFRQSELKRRFGFETLRIYNDFAGIALALPYIAEQDLTKIGGGAAEKSSPKVALGPGTGLGIGSLAPDGRDGWIVLAGEGGHVTMPADDERESALLAILRRRFDHVSAERLLSGDGLVNLYETLCEMDGAPSVGYKPSQITDEAVAARDPHCQEAVAMFCAMLGGVAGNLALTLGARGGVYIAGGIVPRLGKRFADSAFRARFEAKGRFKSYLAAIPTSIIIHGNPALLGLAKLKAA
jgi:glucokinase